LFFSGALLRVGVDGNVTVEGFGLVYNVIPGVCLVLVTAVSSEITIVKCDFSVNGTDSVPQSLIQHLGGRATIINSTFMDIALSSNSLIAFWGSAVEVTDGSISLEIENTTFSGIVSRGNFAAVIYSPLFMVFFYFFLFFFVFC
jgi:hypothetical protein